MVTGARLAFVLEKQQKLAADAKTEMNVLDRVKILLIYYLNFDGCLSKTLSCFLSFFAGARVLNYLK